MSAGEARAALGRAERAETVDPGISGIRDALVGIGYALMANPSDFVAPGPAAATASSVGLTHAEARDLLVEIAGMTFASLTKLPDGYLVQRARRAAHLDWGGDRATWDRVQQAADALGVS